MFYYITGGNNLTKGAFMKKTYQTSVYLDNEEKEKLEFIAKRHKRAKNNIIKYLIAKEYDNETSKQANKEKILKSLHKISGLKSDTTFSRKDIYDDDRI